MTEAEIQARVKEAIEHYPYNGSVLDPVIRHYYPDIMRFISYYSGISDQDFLSDITQQVFASMYRYLKTFRFESSLKSWLIRIAINETKKAGKARGKLLFSDELPENSNFFKNSRAPNFEKELAVQHALGQLKERDRAVLLLFYFKDLSLQEIANILELKESAVKMRLKRAREKFARLWNQS